MGFGTIQFPIQPFNGTTSFTLWQRRVKDVLVQQGLAKALNGKNKKPESMNDDEFEELDARCASTIRLYVADNIINNVIDEEDSAADLWKKLEKLYLAKSLSNKLHLKRQLYALKMVEGGSLMDHMNTFNEILDQLQKVGVDIEEEDKALLLLISVSDSYESVVTTLLYGKDTLEFENVQSSLLDHEKQRKANQDVTQEAALIARGENKRGKQFGGESKAGGSKAKRKGGIQCFGCHEFGHIKKYCPHRRKNDENDYDNVAGYASGGDILTISKGNNTSSRDGWILDSGCVSHVCSRLDYFDTLQRKKAGFMSLGDGSTCQVKGVGVVKIKMLNGEIRSLGGVAYVPKLRRNLISLSQLDSEGYHFSAAGGVLKITHGETVLLMGKKYGNLYHLNTSMDWERKGIQECSQITNGGERKNPAMGEGELRPLSRVN